MISPPRCARPPLTASSSQCSLRVQSQHVGLVVSEYCFNTEIGQVNLAKTRQGGRADSNIAACGSERRPSRHGGAWRQCSL